MKSTFDIKPDQSWTYTYRATWVASDGRQYDYVVENVDFHVGVTDRQVARKWAELDVLAAASRLQKEMELNA